MNEEKKSSSGIRTAKGLFVWVLVLVAMAAISLGGADQGAAEAGGFGDAVESSLPAPEAGGDMDAVESSLPTPTPASAAAGGGTDATPSPAAAESVTPGGKIQSIAFKKEMRIQDALLFLQERYQRNIVPSAKVDGTINVVNLHDVTFEQALDAILGRDFAIETEGNIIKVYTREEYKKILEDEDRKVYKVFTLYYITAAEAEKLVKPVLSATGVIQASSPAEQQISGGGGGSTSGGGSGGGSLGSGGGGDTMALHDTIVIYDYPEYIEKAKEVIQALDVRPKQVLVEATILAVALTEGMELGVDWSLAAGVSLAGTAATEDIVSVGTVDRGDTATSPIAGLKDGAITKGTPIETFGFASQGGEGLRLGITTGDVRVFITALESVTDTTVLANPKILAVNKQEGQVQIGTTLGYRSSTTIGQGGVATEGEVKFLETGTVLTFRPYIGNDGYVRMDIHPKDSSAVLNDDGVPTENVTQCITNIIVKDGETIVIGGLFRDVVTTTRKQVPLLGDIPIIGALFRGKSDSVRREEVIVLLTTHIIEEPSEVEGDARAEDIRRKRFGAKDELQSISRAKMAEDRYAKAARYYIEGDNESAMKELSVALRLRPAYLEAIRLKEKIIGETDPDEAKKLERIILEDIDLKEAPKWIRR
ncbi:MAG: type II secretion system protein GspD [Planctomycetes bacterium]|nr:type II secretion system protein GspD [Planctomycetota bacterium]